MPEYPYIQWFTGDWIKDPKIALCSPATRGIWFDFLNVMHELDRSGVITGTREQLARFGRCSAVELDHALSELTTFQAADVTERNGVVTLINRRMQREWRARKLANDRQIRHRQRASSSEAPPMSRITTNDTNGCGDGSGSGSSLPEGGSGETAGDAEPPDLEAIGDWLERVPKDANGRHVSMSQKLRDAIVRHRYTLEELKDLWQLVTNTPKVTTRTGFLVSQICAGVKAGGK